MRDIFGDDDGSENKKNDFESMLEQSFQKLNKTFQLGDKVTAQVISIGKDEVFVDVEGKDGVVLRSELNDSEGKCKYAVGDSVDLYINKNKGLLQHTTKASNKALSENLEDAFDLESPVEGKVTEVCNGGFRVLVFHKTAFCPISQMDSKHITEPESYVGKKFEFLITQLDKSGRNIVISRRKLLDVQKLENEGQFMTEHKPGDTMNGKVTRLEAFGAFVEIQPGVEGLVHISEVGWSRLKHPSEALELGQMITVKILKIEEDASGRMKISLSKKQADEDPWNEIPQKFPVGSQHTATIQAKEHFGILMQLAPGIVGLLPKSAMKESADGNLEKKNVGESFKVQVQNFNLEDRRISLSLPKEQDDQSWKDFSKQTNQGFGSMGDLFKNINIKK